MLFWNNGAHVCSGVQIGEGVLKLVVPLYWINNIYDNTLVNYFTS